MENINISSLMSADWVVAIATIVLAIITGLLALYTFKLWKSTCYTLEDNKKFSVNQLRAYIGVHQSNFFCNWDANGKIGVIFDLVNYGQTVATKVNMYGAISLVPYPLSHNYKFSAKIIKHDFDGVIFPQEINKISAGFETLNEITLEEKNNILQKNNTLYIIGTITYFDIFNILRKTKFGYFIEPTSFLKNNNISFINNNNNSSKWNFKWSSLKGRNSIK